MLYDTGKFAKKIKDCRAQRGYTQENLAELCSVSRQAVAKWESGKNIPDIASIVLLAKLFNVSVEFLLDIEPSQDKLKEKDIFSYKLINEGLRRALGKSTIDEIIKEYMTFLLNAIGAFRICIYDHFHFSGVYHGTYTSKLPILKEAYNAVNDIPVEVIKEWKRYFDNDEWIYIPNVKEYAEKNIDMRDFLLLEGLSSMVIVPILNGEAFVRIDNIPLAFMSQIKEFYEVSIHFIECFLKRRNVLHRVIVEVEKCRHVNTISGYATYSCNLLTGEVELDENFYKIFDIKAKLSNLEEIKHELSRHPQEDENLFREALRELMEYGKSSVKETLYCLADGRIKWLKVTICPFISKEGILEEIYGVIEDISERHQSIQQYNNIIKNVPGGIYRCYLEENSYLEYVSDGFLQLFGYTREEFHKQIGNDYSKLVYEEDLELYKDFLHQMARCEGSHTCKYRIKTHNNKIKYVIDTMESVLDEEQVMYGYSSLVDISFLNKSQIF